tara:strand:- start:2505 stop:3056 length:552 start_codon:yes stop_codon:yes gene_type:complete
MVYTQKQIKLIQEKRPDLNFQRIPTLDDLIQGFLKKYDVIVIPPKKLLSGTLEKVKADKLTNFSNIELLKTEKSIENNKKEWEQWKKWALDHSDFEKYRIKKILENQIFNKKILEKLNTYEVKQEFKEIFDQSKNFKINKLLFSICITLVIIFSLRVFILLFVRNQNESIFNNSKSIDMIYVS